MKSIAINLTTLIIVGFGFAAGPFAEGAPITREEAVARARDGKTGEAISALRELFASPSGDALVVCKLAVILTWAKRKLAFETKRPIASNPAPSDNSCHA